ncbi:MAG: 1-acyl-sn-glycerol-3-phosphate acyltransferase, partial [Salinivenus sp.]
PPLMKPLFYHLVAVLVRVTSWFMFSRIEVRGRDRVAWDRPCIVSPNHQNAFLDALLVGIFTPVKLTFLSRASVFGTPFDWFLDALHMAPIYRRRDGLDKVAQNKEVFADQREHLIEGGSVVMFSEAEHAHTYYLRPLSRGSARLALTTQQETDEEVQLVPVGINYYHLTRPGFKVSIVFGDPIPVSTYMNQYRTNEAAGMNALRDALAEGMKDCMLVPEHTDDYRERVDRLNRHNEALSFPEMKQALDAPETLPAKGPHRPWLESLAWGLSPLNAGPLWLTNTLMRMVDEAPFTASLKFAVGMFGVPLWWLLLFGLGTGLFGWTAGGAAVGLSALALIGHILLVRWANPPHPLD